MPWRVRKGALHYVDLRQTARDPSTPFQLHRRSKPSLGSAAPSSPACQRSWPRREPSTAKGQTFAVSTSEGRRQSTGLVFRSGHTLESDVGGQPRNGWIDRGCVRTDYENLADTLATFVTLAAIQLGIRRLARR